MAVSSGKLSQVIIGSCTVLEFGDWELTYGSNVHEYNSRAGGGANQTVDGNESGSGTINGFLDPADPITTEFATGALVVLQLMTTATHVAATGSARLGQYGLTANRDGTPVPVSIPFITHGLWTFG